MNNMQLCQIVISGVGGQGVLFITQLLAEAAIRKKLPVFTSETHGMAQRGGLVISHLKVGEFASPLIRPGRADGLIALKKECLAHHGGYLKPGAWAAVNDSKSEEQTAALNVYSLNADSLAQKTDNPKAVNLIMLGLSLSISLKPDFGGTPLYCSAADITSVLEDRLKGKDKLLQASIAALNAGLLAPSASP